MIKINDLHVIYGKEPLAMIKDLLAKIGLAKGLTAEMLIGLKPNLVVAKPAESGATTSPLLVEGIVQYLQEKGFNNIVILESSWVGESTKRAFKVCGYQDISAKYNVPLIDLKEDSYRTIKEGELALDICLKALEVDYLINIPVLKAHSQTRFTCALKNLKGCIPDREKRRFHTLGLNRPIAYLAKALPVNLVVVDAINGDLSFEEGGSPVSMNRIIVGKDPVLVDTYGAGLLGYSRNEIEYIEDAVKLGVGSGELASARIFEYNSGEKSGTVFKPGLQVRRLAGCVVEKAACSACYGSLIHALQRLDQIGKLAQVEQLFIGQGFKKEERDGIGIGSCTAGFSSFIPGCPPSAHQIVEFLRNML